MDCGTTLVKYILFVFNALMSVLAVLAIVYGVLILESLSIEGRTTLPTQAIIPICLIPIGSIVLFIAFLGCCGAIRENACMTMCYSIIMLILLIVQLVLVVFVWANKDQLIAGVGELMEEAWQKSNNRPEIFQSIQQSFHCCGVNGISDYALSLRVPDSTCCDGSICTPLNSYKGCTEKFTEFMSGSTDNAKYFGLGLIIVEVVGFIFACCLANNIRNVKRRNDY